MAKRKDPWPSGKKAAHKRYRAALREARKLRGFRFTDDSLWRQEGEFFVKATTMTLNDRLGVFVSPDVKTLASDDILWDVLGFQSNKEAYVSLRATGAFTVPGARVGINEGCIAQNILIGGEGEIEELAEAVVEFVDDVSSAFLDSIGRDVRRYFELTSTGEPFLDNSHTLLYRCIAYIYLGQYEKAIELADRQLAKLDDMFKFGVGSKSDATLVKEYCERRLAGIEGDPER